MRLSLLHKPLHTHSCSPPPATHPYVCPRPTNQPTNQQAWSTRATTSRWRHQHWVVLWTDWGQHCQAHCWRGSLHKGRWRTCTLNSGRGGGLALRTRGCVAAAVGVSHNLPTTSYSLPPSLCHCLAVCTFILPSPYVLLRASICAAATPTVTHASCCSSSAACVNHPTQGLAQGGG